jgi:oxygen-dependent protoporphyrinogen oxidase
VTGARVVIVGGGISGLALAYRLEQLAPAIEVTVLEQLPRIGGTIHTEQLEGFRVEAGPNGFLDSNPATLKLCHALGLGDRLVAASEAAGRNRFLLLDGRLQRLPNSLLSFLFTGALGWRSKLALLTERFRSPRRESGDESVEDFAIRRAGRQVAETLVDAFVTGIHAGDPRLLSVQAAFPRLTALEREHGSVLRGMAISRKQRRAEAVAAGRPPPSPPRLWSFREGLGLLIDTLRQHLRRPPFVGVRVRRVQWKGRGWRIEAEGRDAWEADAVVLTCPAHAQAEMLADVDPALAEEIAGIAYNAVAVVGLGYRDADVPVSLEGFGYLAPQRPPRDVLGVQWCSSIFPDRAPPGFVLLRAICGGWRRPEVVGWDDERLTEAVRADLRQVLRIEAAPLFRRIVRWPRAIPQYHLGHLERVARVESRLAQHPGLYLGGNAYHGVALNDCVEQAGLLAERILPHLAGGNWSGAGSALQ